MHQELLAELLRRANKNPYARLITGLTFIQVHIMGTLDLLRSRAPGGGLCLEARPLRGKTHGGPRCGF